MKKKVVVFVMLLLVLLSASPKSTYAGGADVGWDLPSTSFNGVIANVTAGEWINLQPPAGIADRDVYMLSTSIHPHEDSCIEAAVEHFSASTSSATGHWLMFYDHCTDDGDGAGVQARYGMDATFQSKYFYTYNLYNQQFMTIAVERGSGTNCWEGKVWNKTTVSYDVLASVCGTTQVAGAWIDFFLTGADNVSPTFCPSFLNDPFKSVAARDVLVRIGAAWSNITAAQHTFYSNAPNCVSNGSYTFTEPNVRSWKITD